MQAALDLFAERGYSAVSVDDIARAAGVTKGAVYYWFADKDDLGRDLQHEVYDRLATASLLSFDPEGDAVTNLRRAFHVYLDELGSLGRARFFLRDAWTIPELDGGRRAEHDATTVLRGMLASAIDRGEIVDLDPEALAHMLMGAWSEATLHVLTTGERAPTLDVVEHLIESLRTHPAAGDHRRARAEKV